MRVDNTSRTYLERFFAFFKEKKLKQICVDFYQKCCKGLPRTAIGFQ